MKKYSFKLEIIDPEDQELNEYLRANGIKMKKTGVIYPQPGGGEDVIFTGNSRAQLVALFVNRLQTGDVEYDTETLSRIFNVPETLKTLKSIKKLWDKHGVGDSDKESSPVYDQLVSSINNFPDGV